MKITTQLAAATAVLVCAHGVSAQDTAETVFDELIGLYGTMGMTVEIGERMLDGEVFTASNVVFVYSSSGVKSEVTVDEIQVSPSEEPDYAFAMVFDDAIETTVTTEMPGEVEPMEISMLIEQPGNTTLVGGTAEARTFAYSADVMRMTVDQAPMAGPDDDMAFDMVIALTELSGLGETVEGESGLTYEGVSAEMEMSYKISADDGGFDFSSVYTDVTFAGEGPLAGMVDAAAMLASGVTSKGRFTMASSETRVEVMDEFSGPTLIEMTSGPGTLDAAIANGHFDYGFSSETNVINASGASLPIPTANLTADVMSLRLAMPVAPTDAPGEMAINLALEEVSISEDIWAMFDPTAGLPRTPATLILRARSTATALVNIMDPDAMQDDPAAAMMPYDFDDVSIEELRLSIAGVELEAVGKADLVDAGPVPMPVGGIDISLAGALGLIEKLQAIGLVPPDQAAAAPMMLGMFAQPGDAPDTFVSRIEMTEDGQILANGVPIQ
ncbi:MAG: DUF2125 domain-containing protein [Pseudomonadota bacterium]